MHIDKGWDDYLYFLKVATCGSIKGAAHELGVNYSSVFRRVNALEEKLQVRLFERLKAGYTLTRAGEDILERVQQVEEQMNAIQRLIQGKDVQLSGYLKISTTDTIGYYWLPPYITRFKALYPNITIDIDIKTRFTNLSKREADIVMPAINNQPDYMVGKKLAPIHVRLYGNAAYVERYGSPTSPADLHEHHVIMPNEALAGLPANKWLRKYVNEENIVACCDKLTGLYHLANQGLGLTILPHYIAASDPRLVELMALPPECNHHIWILTHPDIRFTARVKAFIQFMYKETEGAYALGGEEFASNIQGTND
ncbi:MAG: LysR family transcriptional regulator [Desulfobulbus sp.]